MLLLFAMEAAADFDCCGPIIAKLMVSIEQSDSEWRR